MADTAVSAPAVSAAPRPTKTLKKDRMANLPFEPRAETPEADIEVADDNALNS